jgi:hypothetical protein
LHNNKLQVTSYRSQVTGYKLQITSYKLQIAHMIIVLLYFLDAQGTNASTMYDSNSSLTQVCHDKDLN